MIRRAALAPALLLACCAPALRPLPPETSPPSAGIDDLVATARAGVEATEHEREPAAREAGAASAVQAAQRCVERAPASAACAYWLGAALGVQARERPTTAHSALPRIVAELERAAAADAVYEDAGPDRALALVYLRAPGWPAGPGDPDRGLEHARRAVALRPEHPPNLLALAEALDETEEPFAARETCLRAIDLAREAQRAGIREASGWLKEAEALLARIPERSR